MFSVSDMTLVLPHPALWFGGRQYPGDATRGDATRVARGPRASSRRAAATEDVALVQAIRRDEPGALETLYRSYFERLLRYAYQIVRDDDIAQSLVQDVFVALWERRSTWRMSGSLDSYLYRAIRNRAWNAMRDDRRRVLGAAPR